MNAQDQIILLVEDNEDDVFLMEYALTKTKLNLPMHVADDGQEALDYLGGIGKYSDRAAYPFPSILFLDLKLPFVHGFEVLTWIRDQPSLRELKVVILTSSPEERDRQQAQELGAKAYLVKPPTAQMLLQVLDVVPECASRAF
jgi:CheY-like chemotaxis protein